MTTGPDIDEMTAAVAEAVAERATALRDLGVAVSGNDARTGAWQRLQTMLDSTEAGDRADAAVDLAAVLWPTHTWPPLEWWATSLGKLVAAHHPDPAAVAHPDGDQGMVVHREAAAMLGVARSTVTTYAIRGDLAMDPVTKRIPIAAVLDRIARRWAR